MVLKKSKARPHIFIFIFFKCQKPMYGLDAHVWPREGGHTPFRNHSVSEPSESHTMISE